LSAVVFLSSCESMKPAPFRYHAPQTIDEAVAILSEVAADDGRILAGGQSLVPTMAFRLARPAHLVDINGIEALAELAANGESLSIGACVRHAAFHRPVVDGPLGNLLSAVVRHIGHYPIRTRGTFCGSLAHADPASEWCLVAAALGGEIVAKSARGTRSIAAEDFFAGMMSTVLEDDELLTETRLPALPADTRFGFCEFSRRAGDFAIAMALVTYRLHDGLMREPRVGIGGVEAKPRRVTDAEAVLEGKPPAADTFRAAAEAAADVVEPIEDLITSAAYRRDLVRALTRRALEQAAG
jgi:carbon-monoxide dehydrogenase medium subunit